MNLDAIREREVRERRRSAIYGALVVLVAFTVFSAIVWSYVN
jgi:hypothetical protein